MNDCNWTDDRVEQLKSLWADGLSASQVAYALGGVSRNAVIGKVHRLGLEGRANSRTVGRPRLPSVPKLRAPSHTRAIVPVIEEEPLKLEDGGFATVVTVNDRMCRWPIGDPKSSVFHFCGHAPEPGSCYCEAHARRAHQPGPPKRKHKVRRAAVAGFW